MSCLMRAACSGPPRENVRRIQHGCTATAPGPAIPAMCSEVGEIQLKILTGVKRPLHPSLVRRETIPR